VTDTFSSYDRPLGETTGSSQRPVRHLAGSVLGFDLGAELASLQAEAGWQGGDRNARTLVEEPTLRVVLVVMKRGARLREHDANGRVSVHTLAGFLRLRLPVESVDLPAGHLLTLERALAHDVEALEDSAFLLTIAWEGRDDGEPGPHGYRRSGDPTGAARPGADRGDGEDPRLRRQYRVLRMEPLIGDDRADERTEAAPGTKGSAAGPMTQAGREFEGQTVTLDQLAGMGAFTWDGDRFARLDTASESYRVELEPLPPRVT
jgi:quercetin dioxygenase-like cupin family protein